MWKDLVAALRRDDAGRTLELSRDATVRLPRRRGPWRVRAVQGTVLVTREGDPEDHVLEAGAELVLAPAGLVVVWALTASRIELRRAGRGAVRRRRLRPAEAA